MEIWVTRNGERIAMRSMTDSHLANAIRLLERSAGSAGVKHKLYRSLVAECARRAADKTAGRSLDYPGWHGTAAVVSAPARSVRLITLIDEEV